MFANYEFLYNLKEKEEEEDILNKKLEITATVERKKRKKVKSIEITFLNEKQSLSFWNIIYIHFDVYTNYLIISLIFYLLKEAERNILAIIVYSFICLLLFFRVK